MAGNPPDPRIEALNWLCAHSVGFHGLARRRGALLELATVQMVRRDAVLSPQDRRPAGLFAVLEGRVAARIRCQGPKGGTVVRELGQWEAGETAGLLALVSCAPMPFELAASEPGRVLHLDGRALGQLRAAFHPLALALAEAFTPELIAWMRSLDRRACIVAEQKQRRVSGYRQVAAL